MNPDRRAANVLTSGASKNAAQGNCRRTVGVVPHKLIAVWITLLAPDMLQPKAVTLVRDERLLKHTPSGLLGTMRTSLPDIGFKATVPTGKGVAIYSILECHNMASMLASEKRQVHCHRQSRGQPNRRATGDWGGTPSVFHDGAFQATTVTGWRLCSALGLRDVDIPCPRPGSSGAKYSSSASWCSASFGRRPNGQLGGSRFSRNSTIHG